LVSADRGRLSNLKFFTNSLMVLLMARFCPSATELCGPVLRVVIAPGRAAACRLRLVPPVIPGGSAGAWAMEWREDAKVVMM
jgi:hypothetical protein